MKNILYTIFFLCGWLGIISCQSEQPTEEKGTGYVSFEISADQQPEVILSRAGSVDVDDLIVSIEDSEGNKIELDENKYTLSYRELKEVGLLELEANRSYIIRAMSSVDMQKESDSPTYEGQSLPVYINQGLVAVAKVECKRREVEIQVDLSALYEIISDLTAVISLNDGVLTSLEIGVDTGITDSHFFAPDSDLQLKLSGKYNGLDLGILGGPFKIVDFINDKEIKAHTKLLITVDIEPNSNEPVSGNFSGFNLQIKDVK